MPPVMVIGFVGGFVKHDARAHSTVQVVEHLRNEYREGVYVQSFANRHRGQAYKEIVRRLDGDNDGTLSAEEKHKARIVIFGHSWGASETVTLARKLERDGIPVLLTIQVDSVAKIGQNDAVIPANVGQADQFLPAGWNRARAAPDSGCRSCTHGNPGKFSLRLPGESHQLRGISVVRSVPGEGAHGNRVRSEGLEPGGIVDLQEIVARSAHHRNAIIIQAIVLHAEHFQPPAVPTPVPRPGLSREAAQNVAHGVCRGLKEQHE